MSSSMSIPMSVNMFTKMYIPSGLFSGNIPGPSGTPCAVKLGCQYSNEQHSLTKGRGLQKLSCMYVHIYMHIQVCIQTYVYSYVCVYVYMYVCMYVCVYIMFKRTLCIAHMFCVDLCVPHMVCEVFISWICVTSCCYLCVRSVHTFCSQLALTIHTAFTV